MSTLISEISFLSRHPAWYICHGAILQLSSRTFSEMAWSPIRCRWMGLTKYQFFGKKYIFLLGKLLEIMKKKAYQQEYLFIFASELWYWTTNANGLGIFLHISILSLKQGNSTSCFQNVRLKLQLMGNYNPIHYNGLTFSAGLSFNMV